MMSRWLGTMNSPHMSMPTAYGNAMATPNCSRPGSNITTPAMSFAVQMNGSRELGVQDGEDEGRGLRLRVAGGHDGRVGDVDVVEVLQA